MTEQEVVLITGTSRGIGHFLVEHFLQRGALVEGCARSPVDWELPGYTHHQVDVSNEGQVKAMLSAIQRRHGRLDIAINNAGIAAMNHALLTPGETASRILNINVLGSFLVCREAAKLMRRRNYGRIVNFSTIAVPLRLEGEALYAAAKSAVEMLTRILAREFAPFGITVNAIGPTPIATDLIRSVPREKLQHIIDTLAIRRFGTFADLAHVIDFFVHPASNYITGQVIYLGGGG
ncbi:SDR family NAD(P)-dependent oxidoreductase [Chloroflexus aggregans]|uniref:Short-chain dehydrogenase/reductase SDR n=1 Tax=Chloroflexus aggregans (strain MD-66 / DSM 9485) TaxID=326427 RepID=B8G5M4_CHLAD|nr:SDR family oxidoreductase [Chloroflexus aggregans]ACL23735.1 short-chain dehydrogenase/reductase SDR [Chloroflexus aggregans DSM 9485]